MSLHRSGSCGSGGWCAGRHFAQGAAFSLRAGRSRATELRPASRLHRVVWSVVVVVLVKLLEPLYKLEVVLKLAFH